VKCFLKKLSCPFVFLFLEVSFLPQLRNQILEFKTFHPGVTSLLFFILLLILAMNLQTSARQTSKTLIILKKKLCWQVLTLDKHVNKH